MLWFALVAVKALRVAKMNPQTALAVLGSPEALSIAFFVLLAAIPTIFFAFGFVAWYWGFGTPEDRGVAKRVAAVSAYLVALTFTTAIAPLINTILVLMLPITTIAIHLHGSRRRAAPRIDHPVVVEARAIIEEAETLDG